MASGALLYQDIEEMCKSEYYDWRSGITQEDYKKRLTTSTTLYVGNLSIYTNETQLLELFRMGGNIRHLHMGLNNKTFKPCGFCFVEYYTREEAAMAIDCLNLVTLDRKQIRIDWDYGFLANRRFGRGRSGGQVRAEIGRESEQDER